MPPRLMHETPAQSDPVIVILEDRAHWRLGHFSKNFAELADGFVELGCRTEVLTSLGWAGDMKGHGFGLHRYSGVGRLTTRLLPALKGLTTAINHSPLRRMGPFLFRVQLMLTTWTSVRETRRLLRREHLVPTGIIVLSIAFSLRTLEHLARDERWIVYPLSTYVPSRREVARSTKNITVARASTQPTPLADIYPILTVNFSVGRQVRHRAGLLRDRLGIDPSTTMLLMVGAGHIWQDPATVIDAVRTRDDLQLVVVGGMADELDRYDLNAFARRPIAVPGHVPIDELDPFYDAADVVAISVREGFPHDSGVLLDAASHGVPVVVAGPSTPASVVAHHGAGEVFVAGSATSFIEALDRLDLDDAARGIAALADHYSARNVAATYLDALTND